MFQTFLNWNTVPMTFNDSWTYMEMLGKCFTQVDINARNIETNRQNIETNRQNIERNRAQIEVNKQAIQALDDRLTMAESDIEELDNDLHSNYYTKVEVDAKFDAIDLTSYLTRAEAEETYAKLETLGTTYVDDNNITVYKPFDASNRNVNTKNTLLTTFADIDSQRNLAVEVLNLKQNLKDKAISQYIPIATENIEVSDSVSAVVARFQIPTTVEFEAVQVNYSYTITVGENDYDINKSMFIDRNTSGKDFVMYNLESGGQIMVSESDDNFFVTIAKPSGTEPISIHSISVIIYKAETGITIAEKIAWLNQMDVNGDGFIDAKDASQALSWYSAVSTGASYSNDASGFRQFQIDKGLAYNPDKDPVFPDANRDGVVDSSDASYILGWYSEMAMAGHWADTEEGKAEGWYLFITDRDAFEEYKHNY